MTKFKVHLLLVILHISALNFAQQTQNQDGFWSKVRYGGGFAANFGNNFTVLGVSPTAIYPLNDYFALGLSAQFNYMEQRNLFKNTVYGAGIVGLINPIKELQLSVELDQLRVNQKLENPSEAFNFWNTALFLGAGYQSNNVIFGFRYNVLFRQDDQLYTEAWMPFVRVFF